MGSLFQSQDFAKVGKVLEHLCDTAIIGLEEVPQGRDGEQLRLGKDFRGEWAGIGS